MINQGIKIKSYNQLILRLDTTIILFKYIVFTNIVGSTTSNERFGLESNRIGNPRPNQ